MDQISFKSFNFLPLKYPHDNELSFKGYEFDFASEGNVYGYQLLTDCVDTEQTPYSNLAISKYDKTTSFIELSSVPNTTTHNTWFQVKNTNSFISITDITSLSAALSFETTVTPEVFTLSAAAPGIYQILWSNEGIQYFMVHDKPTNTLFLSAGNFDQQTTDISRPDIFAVNISDKDSFIQKRFVDQTGSPSAYQSLSAQTIVTADLTTNTLYLSTAEDTIFAGLNLSQFSIRPIIELPQAYLNNKFNIYTDGITNSRVEIDTGQSYNDLKTNLFLHNEVNLSVSAANIDFFPLKTLETTQGYSNLSNPISSNSLPQQRQYNSMDVVANNDGNIFIDLNYSTFTSDFKINADSYTQFTIPTGDLEDIDNSMYPYKQVNVNDTFINRQGAIAGTTPRFADKIFTKRKQNSLTTSERTGQYLCTWLSGGGSLEQPGMWMDRYYNPSLVNWAQAFSVSPQTTRYQTQIEQLSTSTQYNVFDKVSDLIFLPGEQYTFFHIGDNYIENVLNEIEHLNVIQGSTLYNLNNQPKKKFTNEIINFDLNSSNYLTTQTLSLSSNSCTLVFDIESFDWRKRFGHMIFGNYLETGFACYNETKVTPLGVFYSDRTVYIYNTNFELINTVTFDEDIRAVTRTDYAGNIFVVFKDASVKKISPTGVVLDRSTIATDLYEQIQNIYMTDEYSYLSVNDLGLVARINHDTTNIDFITVTENYIVSASGGASSDDWIPLEAVPIADIYIAYKDADTPAAYSYFYDVSGNTGYTLDGHQPTFVTSTEVAFISSNNTDLSVYDFQSDTYETIAQVDHIDDFVIDEDNNFIYLHDNGKKITKLTRNKDLLATTDVYGASDSLVGVNIDIITRFNDKKYEEFICVICNNDGKVTAQKYDKNLLLIESSDLGFNYPTLQNYRHKPFNYGFLRQRQITNQGNVDNSLNFTLKLKNEYNREDTTRLDIFFPLKNLSKGPHSFCCRVNSEDGEFSLYVDGILQDTKTFDDLKFAFNDTFDTKFFVGATPFFNNFTLADFIKIPNSYFAFGNAITNLSFYETALSYDIIKYFTYRTVGLDNIIITLPTGLRNFTETIETLFRYQLPPTKSNYIDITINNAGINNPDLRDRLTGHIKSKITPVLPANLNVSTVSFT